MDTPLPPYFALVIAGLAVGALAYLFIAFARGEKDRAAVAAMLCGAFAGFTAVVAWADGPITFLWLHSETLWGVQVIWDLVIALGAALLLAAPRARAVGMRVPLYVLLTALTGSIGLLAMLARLFWLERRAAA